jgi:antitoxin (DNA-binding transcriptional repressor) of toxin-antitoxin stability system
VRPGRAASLKRRILFCPEKKLDTIGPLRENTFIFNLVKPMHQIVKAYSNSSTCWKGEVMHEVQLQEAQNRFAELIDEVANGEEVRITRADGAIFKIVLMLPTGPRPKFGSAKGQISMSDDFDEPLEDFQEYMP